MTARWAVRAATETEPSRPRTGVGETEPLMGSPPDPSPFRRKGTQCAQINDFLKDIFSYFFFSLIPLIFNSYYLKILIEFQIPLSLPFGQAGGDCFFLFFLRNMQNKQNSPLSE